MSDFDRREFLDEVDSGDDVDDIGEIHLPEMSLLAGSLVEDEWSSVEKRPVTVEARGPFTDPAVVETLEGDYEVDEEYVEEHGGYVLLRGVDGEVYPCALDIFEETYRLPEPDP